MSKAGGSHQASQQLLDHSLAAQSHAHSMGHLVLAEVHTGYHKEGQRFKL